MSEQRIACDQIAPGQVRRSMESYSVVTGLAGLYLLLQLLNFPDWSRHHQGNAVRLDSIIDEAQGKDPECVLFCADPQLQARHSKLDTAINSSLDADAVIAR
jgi:hypothetical protein